MKKVFGSIWESIRTSAVIYLLISIVIGIIGGNSRFASGYGMARSGAAVILIGIGFGLPVFIYKMNMRTELKVVIHMGIGCVVMIVASILGGWLPVDSGVSAVFIAVMLEIAAAFVVWGANFIPAFLQVKRMNEKIKNHSSQQNKNTQE